MYLEKIECWSHMKKAIFWDLQGTLGGAATEDVTGVELYPFSAEAVKLSMQKGYLNIIITNQSKIGKGEISFADYEKTVKKLMADFAKEDAVIDEFLVCPHTSKDSCNCKKPKTGLIDLCVEKYMLDISKCCVIGDMGKNEIVMARNAGCKGILVLTGGGKGSLHEFRDTWAEYEADDIAENALEAVKLL